MGIIDSVKCLVFAFALAGTAVVTCQFFVQVDRRHALYRGHETLRDMLGREDPKGMALLENLRELEEKCVEDMEETLICWQEENAAKVAHIFQHMANLELNFYE